MQDLETLRKLLPYLTQAQLSNGSNGNGSNGGSSRPTNGHSATGNGSAHQARNNTTPVALSCFPATCPRSILSFGVLDVQALLPSPGKLLPHVLRHFLSPWGCFLHAEGHCRGASVSLREVGHRCITCAQHDRQNICSSRAAVIAAVAAAVLAAVIAAEVAASVRAAVSGQTLTLTLCVGA